MTPGTTYSMTSGMTHSMNAAPPGTIPSSVGPDGHVGVSIRDALGTEAALEVVFVLFIAVGAGAFLGGIARWALSRMPGTHVGTWTANVVGSAVFAFSTVMPGLWPAFLGAGFGGALSTLSTLAKEAGTMVKNKQWHDLASYVLATAVGGIIAAWFGLRWASRAFM